MITHFDATIATRHRQIEMERLLQHRQQLAMRAPMSNGSRLSTAGGAILALLGKGRTRSISPHAA